MGFHNIRFPDDISYGSRGGPGFHTELIRLDSGAHQAVSRWEEPLHSFDVGYGIKTPAQLYALKTFFWARLGAAHTFRYKDWGDYATTADGITDERTVEVVTKDDVIIGTGDASETQFQLVKKYSDAVVTRTRNIVLPVEGSVLLAVNGSLQTETTHYSIDYATGWVTIITPPPSGHDVTWGGEFDVHCRFSESTDEILQLQIDDFGSGSSPGIVIDEERSVAPIQDEFWFGGAVDRGDLSVDFDITLQQGRVQVLKPTTSGLNGKLQRTDDIPFGGPVWYLLNSGTDTLNIVDQDDSLMFTIPVDSIAEVLIAPDSAGNKTYVAK